MDELKLKPCPFYGHEPELVDAEIDGRAHYIVKCGACYSTSGVMQLSKPAAVAAWNRRAERTCRMERVEWRDAIGDHEIRRHKFVCGNCGLELEADLISKPKYPYQYCPSCGAKVVEG